MKFGGIIIAVH